MRNWDIFSLEKRIFNLEKNGGSTPSQPWDYSTTETDTHQKWTDGKEIYCKVVTGTFVFRAGNAVEILSDVSDIEHIIDFRIVDTVTGSSSASLQCWIEAGKLSAISPYLTNASNAIIYYTKVTPAKSTKRSKKA